MIRTNKRTKERRIIPSSYCQNKQIKRQHGYRYSLTQAQGIPWTCLERYWSCVGDNGWLPPWWEDDRQNLRLVSRTTKITLDEKVGLDFESIVEWINARNGFHRESGGCD
eukprot:scaffold7729_cov172-Amphora_coffeaeformis.AAC.1